MKVNDAVIVRATEDAPDYVKKLDGETGVIKRVGGSWHPEGQNDASVYFEKGMYSSSSVWIDRKYLFGIAQVIDNSTCDHGTKNCANRGRSHNKEQCCTILHLPEVE